MMWFGGGSWLMALSMLVFWAGVILLIIWGVRALDAGGRRDGTGGPRRRPLEILEERYARGEIDQQEFEQRRSTLEGL